MLGGVSRNLRLTSSSRMVLVCRVVVVEQHVQKLCLCHYPLAEGLFDPVVVETDKRISRSVWPRLP
jgi:hypothetical protein